MVMLLIKKQALLHCYTNTFCDKAKDPKSQNTQDTPDFWLENKIFHSNLCVYAFMYCRDSFLISASLPIIT